MKNSSSSFLNSPFVKGTKARAATTVGAGAGAILLFLAGCSSEPVSHVVSAPPPPAPTMAPATTSTTTTTPVTTVTGNGTVAAPGVSTTVVTQTPPPPQADVVLAQPSPQHVWIPGYWTWRDERYEWVAGHWELPPNSGATWVVPRWEREGNAYRFYEGYWN